MAKEQIHSYLRTGVTLAVIVFAGGGWTFQIAGNTGRIAEEKEERVEADDRLKIKTEKLQEATHLLALNAKDTHSLAAKAAEAMVSIDAKFSTIQVQLNNQATIQAINSTKLETLTKD
jgi:hypothetical protein